MAAATTSHQTFLARTGKATVKSSVRELCPTTNSAGHSSRLPTAPNARSTSWRPQMRVRERVSGEYSETREEPPLRHYTIVCSFCGRRYDEDGTILAFSRDDEPALVKTQDRN